MSDETCTGCPHARGKLHDIICDLDGRCTPRSSPLPRWCPLSSDCPVDVERVIARAERRGAERMRAACADAVRECAELSTRVLLRGAHTNGGKEREHAIAQIVAALDVDAVLAEDEER